MARESTRIVSATGDEGNWVDWGSLRFDELYIGAPQDPGSPVAIFVIASPNTGDRVGGLRSHDTQVLVAVIRGTIQLDGAWLKPGDLQFASRGVPHGDLVVGPEGATFMLFFAERQGLIPTFVDEEDQANFDRDLRRKVEEVAQGKSETSFALLPPRESYRPRRGIRVTSMSAARQLAEGGVVERPSTPEGLFRTRIDDDSLPWGPPLLNARTCMVILGNLDDPNAPAVGVINVKDGPGDSLRGRHRHGSDAVNLIIDGAFYMDGDWLRPGEAKVVAANFEYGDGLVGPEGVKFLEIWPDQSGAMPQYSESVDRKYFEEMQSLGHLSERVVI